MKLDNCDLCQMQPVTSGREELLYEDGVCYIVENHDLEIYMGNEIRYAKQRKCLVIKDHKSKLSSEEEDFFRKKLKSFMSERLRLMCDKDYFIRTTMSTYPKHYHTHAIVYPLTKMPQVPTLKSVI